MRSAPTRTCIGCGAKAPPAALVRLRVADGVVTVDRGHGAGRGAWLHAADACLERAIRRRSFGRALRSPGVQVDPRVLRDLLTGNARKD
jgi:predicted RNA-binding protein YlxR (DUF448 family)